MFVFLHRLVIACYCAVVFAALAWVYQRRAMFHPIADLYEVVQIRQSSEPRSAGEVEGLTIKVLTGDLFQMRNNLGQMYQIRLSGLDVPQYPDTPKPNRKSPEFLLADRMRTNLSNLILSNKVRVELGFINDQRTGVGMVYLGETNLNALLAERGMGKLRRDYLKGMNMNQLYTLVHAERKARETGAGIWGPLSGSAEITKTP